MGEGRIGGHTPAGGARQQSLLDEEGLDDLLDGVGLLPDRDGEAFHLVNAFIEPAYFMSGMNFPVGRLGFLGALAMWRAGVRSYGSASS